MSDSLNTANPVRLTPEERKIWLEYWKQDRLYCGHPGCPERVFAAAAGNCHNPTEIEDLVMWCRDGGHWAGFITKCMVKEKEP